MREFTVTDDDGREYVMSEHQGVADVSSRSNTGKTVPALRELTVKIDGQMHHANQVEKGVYEIPSLNDRRFRCDDGDAP